MKNLEFHIQEMHNNRIEFTNNIILSPGQSLCVKSNKYNKYNIFLEIFNPFSLVTFSHWFSTGKEDFIKFKFTQDMPSGLYYLKVQNYLIENSSSSKINENSIIEYFSINFSGKYQNKEWLLTYAIKCDGISGLDIRIAIPKENFPFIMVDSFEGKSTESITTDIWSNWLVFESNSDQNHTLTIGYRSWISLNYIYFSPQSFLEEFGSSHNLINYLMSEDGIESNDIHLIKFSKQITATSILGIIYQILSLIKDHLKFKEQLGEFGAKYALLNKQGDCTEFSALFAALCRIKKIPSRLVAGLKLNSLPNNWIRHAWAEFYYNGLWIPVDVVDGYLIGFNPEIIPLFKGNWMTEGMIREVKISILPEFENQFSQQHLIQVYKSLQISFKVYPKSKAPVLMPKSSELRSTYTYEFNFLEQQEKNTIYELSFKKPFKENKFIIFCYYQCITDNFTNHPKVVNKILHITEKESKDVIKISIFSPEFPSLYEQGIFISNPYGQLLLWEKKQVSVN